MIECSICKANNEDRSLYCLECGQRLQPKFQEPQNKDASTANNLPTVNQNPFQSSGRLHSPILDLEQTENTGRGNNHQFTSLDHDDMGSSRISRNGLHSPLLDGKNYFANPYPEPNQAEPHSRNDSNSHINDKSRLHSPVLDGPFSAQRGSNYVQDDFPTEDQEYESLRSPLLKAKVPLPESHEQIEASKSLQSVLNSATGPVSRFSAQPTNNEAAAAPLSFTGINTFKKAAVQKTTEPMSDKKENIKMSQSLLPADNTNQDIHSDISGQSSLNKVAVTIFVLLALGFKVYYFASLGSAAYTSISFILDQAGQALVMISVMVLALNVRK